MDNSFTGLRDVMCFCSDSAEFCFIKIHAEMAEKSQVKNSNIYFDMSIWVRDSRFCILSLILIYCTHKSFTVVENKSKTSLIRHIQKKYITHDDQQYSIYATHSYNIVVFIRDILFQYMSFKKFSYYMYFRIPSSMYILLDIS